MCIDVHMIQLVNMQQLDKDIAKTMRAHRRVLRVWHRHGQNFALLLACTQQQAECQARLLAHSMSAGQNLALWVCRAAKVMHCCLGGAFREELMRRGQHGPVRHAGWHLPADPCWCPKAGSESAGRHSESSMGAESWQKMAKTRFHTPDSVLDHSLHIGGEAEMMASTCSAEAPSLQYHTHITHPTAFDITLMSKEPSTRWSQSGSPHAPEVLTSVQMKGPQCRGALSDTTAMLR